MLSDNELFLHLSEARALIESKISATVWRTAIRIQELIRMEFPHSKYNEAISDEVTFSLVLSALYNDEELDAQRLPELAGEYYEEGHHEPVLLSDTQILKNSIPRDFPNSGSIPTFQRINVRAIIVQRELFRLLGEGYDFREASRLIYELKPEIRDAYVREFWGTGMSKGNIFYKKRESGRRSLQSHALPKIPEIIA